VLFHDGSKIGSLPKPPLQRTAAAIVPRPECTAQGNGEIRNRICGAGALRVERIDYFPGYRTRAGTGMGLCFAVWR
jgi:hypothetical protein